MVMSAGNARAGYKMELDENHWISLGIGLRVEAGTNEDPSDDWESNFTVDSIRPYIAGQVHEYIKFEANFDYNANRNDDDFNQIQLLDAIVKLEFNDLFNVWGGRMLPPTDRANLSGPYFLNAWAFPLVAEKYPQVFQGRDNGAALWGQVGGGVFKYQLGLFEGNPDADAPQFNGRLVLNLLDPEPGYYNSSTYFGEKDILALGGSVYYQHQGSGQEGVGGKRRDFTGWNVDLLFELQATAAGSPTIDAAYFNYDNDNFVSSVASPATRANGESFYVTGGWYLPGEYGVGGLQGLVQPHVRYQKFYNDSGPNQSRWDAGVSWYIQEQNAKLVVYYSHMKGDLANAPLRNAVNVGFQLQF
jgi:hypothetical protein